MSIVYKSIEIPYDQVPQFSKRDIAYQLEDTSLDPFHKYKVELDSFDRVISDRMSFNTNRKILVETLLNQYKSLTNKDKTLHNINSLNSDSSFTIVTAHQPSLLTGPLYFIYKICSTIKLCQTLNDRYPNKNIIPIFILGGEDHDFEEIASVNFFGKTFTWETDQTGSTGRMKLSGLDSLLSQVKETFGTAPFANQLSQIIDESYSNSTSYADFIKLIVHSLFGRYGLVVLNMDNPLLKKELLRFVLNDLKNDISYNSVNIDQEALEHAGHKRQAHARKVNIFLLGSKRERVIRELNGTYTVGDKNYSTESLISHLSKHPEIVSPNVILRPLYQEIILPNLAYIGGGGELAYWMERVTLFKEINIPFPMLIRRDSVLILDAKSHQILEKSNISISQLFDREEQLIINYTKASSDKELDLKDHKKRLRNIFEEIKSISKTIDPTLVNSVNAEETKSIKSFENIENKMLKAEKRKNEVEINKLSKLKNKFFPNNDSLQERHDNFIPYYLKYGDEWIDLLIHHLDPMNKSFKVLVEKEN